MSPGEVLYRFENKIQAVLEKKGIGMCYSVPPATGTPGNAWLTDFSGFDTESYKATADRILSGRYSIFSIKNIYIGFPPEWNKDPRTGTIAPMHFGKNLNYRDESIVGDIKYLWEPNRHLELVTLAQAYRLTGDTRYSSGAQTLLSSWLQQCPYPLGVNWTSSLEHSVRLVNWSFAWHLLGGDDSVLFKGEVGVQFKQDWLNSIYQHLHFIGGHFSKYSSANNHLLGEYMGLFIGSITWPLWKKCSHWRQISKKGLIKEVMLQNASDGVNLEQGIWYHHEVADMMLLCAMVGRTNDVEFPESYWNRLEKMLDFIASLMDVKGNIPMFGDSDDAVMVRFSPEPDHDVYRSLLATGAVLFDRADFKEKAVQFDDKSRWLLGAAAGGVFGSLIVSEHENQLPRVFPEGGYYVFGEKLDTSEEVRLIADAGPLGYLSIAAHGHADALSFTLSVAGQEILVDPGTYAYHTQKQWRDYFRGTSAHNTVRVDSQDQSVAGGNFLWTKHANANCIHFESDSAKDCWIAEHDGYLRLTDPVKHIRSLIFDKENQLITVGDKLQAEKKHFTELYWHLSEKSNAHQDGDAIIVVNQDVQISIKMLNANFNPEIIKGCEEPPLGWISRGFDLKIPTNTIRWAGDITGTTELVTEIRIEKRV